MKKVLFTLTAVATLAACSTEKTMDFTKDAIEFGEAFIDNATKAAYDGSYNTGTLAAFEVYATITGEEGNTANIFNKEIVVKGNSLGQGSNWSYNSANTQYWISGNSYHFRAIADGNVEGVSQVVAPTAGKYMATAINLLDASAQKDLLVAEENISKFAGGAHVVEFTFSHILSKAKFTVKNTVATNNGYTYKVSNIRINGIAKNGVYTIGSSEWTAAATPATYDLSFGNAVAVGTVEGAEAMDITYNAKAESNYDRLLIPVKNQVFNITFDYLLLKDGIVIDTQVDKTIITEALTLESGHAYNFVFSLGNPGEPIQFNLEKVTGWVPAGTVNNEETPID